MQPVTQEEIVLGLLFSLCSKLALYPKRGPGLLQRIDLFEIYNSLESIITHNSNCVFQGSPCPQNPAKSSRLSSHKKCRVKSSQDIDTNKSSTVLAHLLRERRLGRVTDQVTSVSKRTSIANLPICTGTKSVYLKCIKSQSV